MRTFLAVWPDRAALDTLAGLERPEVPGLRWTRPDQWHVTLRFCGSVADDDLPGLVDAVSTGLADQPPVAARMGPATARFGDSILHVPVDGLDEVAGRVLAASAAFGDSHDERPFRGHLTLARARRRHRVPRALVRLPLVASWPVTEVTIVSSAPQPGGSRYRTEAAIPLAG